MLNAASQPHTDIEFGAAGEQLGGGSVAAIIPSASIEGQEVRSGPCPPRAPHGRYLWSFTASHGEPKPLLKGSVLPVGALSCSASRGLRESTGDRAHRRTGSGAPFTGQPHFPERPVALGAPATGHSRRSSPPPTERERCGWGAPAEAAARRAATRTLRHGVVHVREQDLDENVSVKALSNSEVIHIPLVI